MERVLQAADRWQHRHRWLSFGVAAWKKFGDFLGAREAWPRPPRMP
jgi:hypothetical protein